MVAGVSQVHELIEQLRKAAIGKPQHNEKKQVFEYQNQTIETVVILKLVRAAQSLTAVATLAEFGLFIDFGAIIRSFNDCIEDVYFLLETYPKQPSTHVEQYIKAFFEHTIDGIDEAETVAVKRAKIQSAVVRVLNSAARGGLACLRGGQVGCG